VALELGWSPEALEDIEQIAEYIERDSGWYAQAVVSRIVEVAESAASFPLRGRVVPELRNESVRELFVYSYRVIYRAEESVLILAVVHGRRLLEPALEQRGGEI
jgi:toxin ParE1/3/4